MRALSFAAVVVFVCSLSVEAQTRQFPYDAIVVQDGVYIRSGKGEKYYPTLRLSKGDRVRVKRHDPGGWVVIVPPKGSFSWVPKRYVKDVRNGVGEIASDAEGVVALVGTQFDSDAYVFQRRFSAGQQVEIIGEGMIEVDRDRGPEAMFKIKPPTRESRWLRGQAVIPADEVGRRDLNSFRPSNDSVTSRDRNKSGGFLNERPKVARRSTGSGSARSSNRRDTRVGNSRTTYDSAKVQRDRARLDQLDEVFRTMIKRPPSQWNLAELEAGYLQLQRDAALPQLANQVNLRLPALKRYQKKKSRYDEFVSLTSATTQRDRELTQLASGQNGMSPAAAEILPPPPVTNQRAVQPTQPQPPTPSVGQPYLQQRPLVEEIPAIPEALKVPAAPVTVGDGNGGQTAPAPATSLPQTGPIPPSVVQIGNPDSKPGTTAGPLFDPPEDRTGSQKQEPVPPGMTRVPRRNPKFVGAGIIMRSTELDVPKYVLLAPNGKILAYLDAVGGFDLGKHVNFAVGLQGDRFHNPKWKADYIKVRSAKSINLN